MMSAENIDHRARLGDMAFVVLENCRASVRDANAGTAAVTKAVVATAVVLLPGDWVVAIVPVGRVGVPVKVGEARFALRLSAVVTKAVVASFRDESAAVWVMPFVMPWSVVVDVPAAEPIVMAFVLPARAFVPMPMVRVAPLTKAPVPK
jgi:hypothetical protein